MADELFSILHEQQIVVGIHEKHKTLRTMVICGTIFLIVSVVAWAIVRIALHSWWAEVIAVLFGPTGIISILLGFYLKKVSKRVAKAEEKIKNTLTPPGQPGGTSS